MLVLGEVCYYPTTLTLSLYWYLSHKQVTIPSRLHTPSGISRVSLSAGRAVVLQCRNRKGPVSEPSHSTVIYSHTNRWPPLQCRNRKGPVSELSHSTVIYSHTNRWPPLQCRNRKGPVSVPLRWRQQRL